MTCASVTCAPWAMNCIATRAAFKLDTLKSVAISARAGSPVVSSVTASTGTVAARLTCSTVSPPSRRSDGAWRPMPSTMTALPSARAAST
ncbi:MAG: hypothetical protein ACRENC_06600, partial [Gemmatimonadaceae bacterium]